METLGNDPFAGTTRPAQRGTGSGDMDEMKGKTSELAHKASDRALAKIDGRKDQVSDALEKVADAISDDQIGRYAADYVRRGAEYLRGQSTGDIVSRAQSELRDRPGAMISLCLLAGFTLARLARR